MIKKLLATTIVILFLFASIGNAQEPLDYKVYLPIVVKSMLYDNNWRLIRPVQSTNYVLNPSAEIAGNYSALVGAVITRPTTYQKYGLYSYFVNVAAANDGLRLTLLALTNTEHYVTLRVRRPIPTLYATLNAATKELRLIERIDQDWDLYGVGFSDAEANGATALDITVGSAIDFYTDGIQVEPLPYWTTYIDGTQEGCEWLGAEHGSISRRSGESRAGGESVDLYEEYGFLIKKIVGAGAATKSLSIDSYALLPGGELNNIKVNSREFTIIGKFHADTEEELHENIQALDTELSHSKYVGSQPILIRFNGARVQKEIGVHYNGGLEGDLPAYYDCFEVDGDQWTQIYKWTTDASIQLSAPDPYWREVGESAALLDTNDDITVRIVSARLRATGQWDDLGPPDVLGTYNNIRAFVEDDTYVYVGGSFLNFDNIPAADYIVRYNKRTGVWSALGVGTDNNVEALAIGPDGRLYVGGGFANAGGVGANNIAVWDPVTSTWAALGVGTNNVVYGLSFGLDGLLYACGLFTTAGGAGANYIASWNPITSAWAALGVGLNSVAEDVTTGLDGKIYVIGNFTTAGGAGANYVASWNPTTSAWAALSSGLNARGYAAATGPDGKIYFGGQHTSAGGVSASHIVAWNHTAFEALGSGVNSTVYSIELGPDNIVYTGGAFTEAGGITLADRIAKWNSSSWAHLDLDLPGVPIIYAIHASCVDPVILNNYDLWLGFDTTGTAYIAGIVPVDNEGTVSAFPKIVYNRAGGVGATIETLRNERTGKILWFDYDLQDGETLTIDLTPTQRSIVSSMFGDRLDAILSNSDFASWRLLASDNNISSFVTEAGAPTITAWMLWRDAFDGYN